MTSSSFITLYLLTLQRCNLNIKKRSEKPLSFKYKRSTNGLVFVSPQNTTAHRCRWTSTDKNSRQSRTDAEQDVKAAVMNACAPVLRRRFRHLHGRGDSLRMDAAAAQAHLRDVSCRSAQQSSVATSPQRNTHLLCCRPRSLHSPVLPPSLPPSTREKHARTRARPPSPFGRYFINRMTASHFSSPDCCVCVW